MDKDDYKVTFNVTDAGKYTVAASNLLTFPATTAHKIDIDEIRTIDDVREILRCMDLTVWDDGTEKFARVRKLYKESPAGVLASPKRQNKDR